jgi:hypothetical protein
MSAARLLLLVALVGCGENGLSVRNALPEAVITTYRDGDAAPEGVPTFIHGVVSDPDDHEEELATTWRVDNELVCEGFADDYGATYCEIVLSEDSQRVSLEVVDPSFGADVAFVDLVITPSLAPEATIDAPVAAGTYAAGRLVVLEGRVSDAEDRADTLTVQWTSNLDGRLDDSPPDTSGYAAGAAVLSEGEHFIELTATDSAGKVGTDNVVILVGPPNELPECGWVAPAPGSVLSQGAPVTLSGTVSDPDDDATTLTATWASDVDGPIGASTPDAIGGVTATWSPLSRGAHTLTLTVADPTGDTDVCAASVVVNAPPSAPGVSITPDPASSADDLLAVVDVPATDPDGDALSYAYAWWVDGSPSPYVSDTVPAAATARGQTWRVEVVAFDGYGWGPPGADEREIGNLQPVVTDVQVRPDPGYTTDTLSCAWTFTDPDGDADASTVAWTLDGVAAGTGATLAAAVAYGDVAVCTVTPFDGVDLGAPGSDDLVVSNSPPVVATLAVSPAPLRTSDLAVVAASGSDPDGHAVTLSYAWTVDGAPVGAGTTLDGTVWFERGQTVEVIATPFDGIDLGSPRSSGPMVVANSPPTAPIVVIDPAAPKAGRDDLVCLIDKASSDLDGDPITYAFTWLVDGVPFPAPLYETWLPDDTVSGADTAAGEVWTCTATPTDGVDSGGAASASALVDRSADRVFVTSGSWSGDLGGLAGADALCQSAADDAGLGGAWVAFLSASGATATSRIGAGPYERLDGVTIAVDKASLLDGSLDAPLNVTELGTVVSKAVFTGSVANGTQGTHTRVNGLCDEWENGCGVCYGDHYYAQSGQSGNTNDDWVDWGWQFCSSGSGLYCFEI